MQIQDRLLPAKKGAAEPNQATSSQNAGPPPISAIVAHSSGTEHNSLLADIKSAGQAKS
jgi:hypothetical protein